MASTPDNNNRQIDPALVDRAWAQMHAQLDVAMPQHKAKRFAWWWLVFALVGTSLLAFWLYPGQRTSNNPLQQSPTTPSAELSTPSEAGESQPVAASDLDAAATTSERSNSLTLSPLTNNRMTTPSEAAESQPVAARNVGTAITVLSTLNPQPTTNKKPANPLTLSPLTNKHRPTHWNYYAETQAGLALGENIREGISLGVGVQRNVSNKLKLEAGLNFQRERSSTFINNSASDSMADSMGGFLDTLPEPQSGAYNLTLRYTARNLTTNKVNLYLGSHYQFQPRWALGAGLQLSYYTSAFAMADDRLAPESQGVEFDDLAISELDLYTDNVSYFERDLNNNAVFGPVPFTVRRWQVGFNTSIRYRFARHLETSIQYQGHLTAWPNQDLSFGGVSTVQLGLRYYIR